MSQTLGRVLSMGLHTRSRAWNTVEDLVVAESSEHLRQCLTDKAPPIRIHAQLKSWMGQNGWCPLYGVNLRHEC